MDFQRSETLIMFELHSIFSATIFSTTLTFTGTCPHSTVFQTLNRRNVGEKTVKLNSM